MDFIDKLINRNKKSEYYSILTKIVKKIKNNDKVTDILTKNRDNINFHRASFIPIILPVSIYYKRNDATNWIITNISFGDCIARSELYASCIALDIDLNNIPTSWIKTKDVIRYLSNNLCLIKKYCDIVGKDYIISEIRDQYTFASYNITDDVLRWFFEEPGITRSDGLRLIDLETNNVDIKKSIDVFGTLTTEDINIINDKECHPYILEYLLTKMDEDCKDIITKSFYDKYKMTCNDEGSTDMIRLYHVAWLRHIKYKEIKNDVYSKQWYDTVKESRNEFEKFCKKFENHDELFRQ